MTQAANPPRTYAEWTVALDRFRAGDDSVLPAMAQGTIEWTNVVAERWTRQVADALTARLQAVSRQLQANLDRSGGQAFTIANALVTARRSLAPLHLLAGLPCLPGNVREHLRGELRRWAAETQALLEKGVAQARDNGRTLKAMRDNPLTAPVSAAAPMAEPPPPEQAGPRRRIIL